MNINNINSDIEKVKNLLEQDKAVSPALKTAIEVILLTVTVLFARLNLNSKNSSKPPSLDPNRGKKPKSSKSGNKPGGQKGHKGSTLAMEENPDEIKVIQIDKNLLPEGKYRNVGYEKRQIVDIRISKIITEYQAQIVEDGNGNRYTAPFPGHIRASIQYGKNIRAHAVYMNQYQMIPYHRIAEYFQDKMGLPLSVGSIFNFNKDAYKLLEDFEFVKQKLTHSKLINADETSINVNGKRIWLHTASNDKFAYCYPHEKRGVQAMDDIGILPNFKGVLCHDHWKSYYHYKCLHALCNAHHLRELQALIDLDANHKWPEKMQNHLKEINDSTIQAGGALTQDQANVYRHQYRQILQDGEKEDPPPIRKKGQKGKLKKTKARNLLERLRDYEDDTLRSMETSYVPFTNNSGENDIRMSKVKEKISGCFKSLEGAKIFCRCRSYLLTCQKNGISPAVGLEMLFNGEMPEFS